MRAGVFRAVLADSDVLKLVTGFTHFFECLLKVFILQPHSGRIFRRGYYVVILIDGGAIREGAEPDRFGGLFSGQHPANPMHFTLGDALFALATRCWNFSIPRDDFEGVYTHVVSVAL